MSEALNLSIIEASSFNKIKTFEDQQQCLDTELLRGLGQIFVKHFVHNSLAAEIVHRHLAIDEGMLLLHEQNPAGLEVCKVVPRSCVEESKIRGMPHLTCH